MAGYQPPVEHPVWVNGTRINSGDWPSTGVGVHLTSIEGWEGGVEVEDNREARPGDDGELANVARMRGRELVISGRVMGSSWADVQARKRALAAVFVPTQGEVLLKVPDPAWDNVDPFDLDGVPGDFAVTLDGSTQYATIPYAAALNPAAFTVEAWVKTSTTGATQVIVDNRSSGTAGWLLNLNTTGVPQLQFGGSSTLTATGVSVADGAWHHVAGRYDGTNARLYVDGDLITGPTAATLTPNTGTDPRVGARSHTSPSLFFPGEIDEVAIYSTALSATRFQAHHVAGRGEAGHFRTEVLQDNPVAWYRMHDGAAPTIMADSSGNGYNGSWTGSPTLSSSTNAPLTQTHADSMPGYERVSCRVVEPIMFEDAEGPFLQSFVVALRASDPRIYSDVVTTTTDTTVADDQWSASVANSGTVSVPAAVRVESADASQFTWRVESGGESISAGTVDSEIDIVSPGAIIVDGDSRDVRVTLPSVAGIVGSLPVTVHAYYQFADASGNPQDASGNGYHLTAAGSIVDTYQVPGLYALDSGLGLRLGRAGAGSLSIVNSSLNAALSTGQLPGALFMLRRTTGFAQVRILDWNDGTNGFRVWIDSNGRIQLRNHAGTDVSGTHLLAADTSYFVVVQMSDAGRACRLWVYDAGGLVFSSGAVATSAMPASSASFGISASGAGSGTCVIDDLVVCNAVSSVGSASTQRVLRAAFDAVGASSFGNLANLNGWPRLNPGTNTVTIEAGDTATTGTMTVTHRNARI